RGGVESLSSVSASTARQTLPGDDVSAFRRLESDHGHWIGRQDHGELGYEQHDSIAAGLVCAFAPPRPNELTVPFSGLGRRGSGRVRTTPRANYGQDYGERVVPCRPSTGAAIRSPWGRQ